MDFSAVTLDVSFLEKLKAFITSIFNLLKFLLERFD